MFANIQPTNSSESSETRIMWRGWSKKQKKTNMQQRTSHATHTSGFRAKLERTDLQTVVCSVTKVNKDKSRRDVVFSSKPDFSLNHLNKGWLATGLTHASLKPAQLAHSRITATHPPSALSSRNVFEWHGCIYHTLTIQFVKFPVLDTFTVVCCGKELCGFVFTA